MSALALLALVVVSQTATSTNTVEVRFASGAEWDTNARRSVADPNENTLALNQLGVNGDSLVRVTGQVTSQLSPVANTSVWLRYQLGAKRFFRQKTEDYLSHQFLGQGAWYPTNWLMLSVSGAFRLSRLHSELRDFNLGTGSVAARIFVTDRLSTGVRGGFTGYRFLTDDHFDFRGPSAGVDVIYRFSPKFWIDVTADHHWRSFVRNGFVEGIIVEQVNGALIDTGNRRRLFCDSPEFELQANSTLCTPIVPDETEVDLSAGIQYLGPFRLSARYRVRIRRSTSPYENIDRHRVDVEGTFPIVERLTATGVATVQITDGTSVRDDSAQSEDDENRNNFTVGIRYAITDTIAADLRYALYLDLFSTNDATYRRQLFYFGLGYRTGLLSL